MPANLKNSSWIIEKSREFQKNIYFCFSDYAKTFDCMDHNKLWRILQEMGIPDHLICLLRNLFADQEATVRTGHGTIDWFQIVPALTGTSRLYIVTLLFISQLFHSPLSLSSRGFLAPLHFLPKGWCHLHI